MKQKRRPRKVVATRVGKRLAHGTLVVLLLSLFSCSAAQKIQVKQSQGEQMQETTIEHGSQIRELSFYFHNNVKPSNNLVSWQN